MEAIAARVDLSSAVNLRRRFPRPAGHDPGRLPMGVPGSLTQP